MNNWRLLLLALIAVLQPIASFTERNIFDGRQCCEQQSHPLLRSTDGSFRSTHDEAEDVRLNRNGGREERQIEKISRRTAKIDQRRILDSASRFQRQFRINRITADNDRFDLHYPSENHNRDTRVVGFENRRLNREHFLRATSRRQYERKPHESRNRLSQNEIRVTRFENEKFRNKNNVRDERSGLKFEETIRLKELEERYETRRGLNDRNIHRSSSNTINIERRAILRNNIRNAEIMERRSNSERRSRDNVMTSRRSVSLPNIRISSNNLIRSEHIRASRRQTTGRVDNRRQQSNERRIARDNSDRQNRNRMSTRSSVEDYLDDERRSRNINRDNRMHSRIEASPDIDTRFMSTRSRGRTLDIHQDNELSRRSRYSERVGFRVRDVKLARSLEVTRDVRMRAKREMRERAITRATMDERYQNFKSERIRDIFNTYQQQEQKEHKSTINWQTVLYTIQGIYLCSLLMQIINVGAPEKRYSRNSWWASSTNFVKVD